MDLNPFKESNLEDLQQYILDLLSDKFGNIKEFIKVKWYVFQKKANERLTIMLIPHSEKKIINFHIPLYSITLIISVILITITITSIAIITHASTIKDVSKLKMYGVNSKIQIEKYKEEIEKLYEIFQKFKPEISNLYSLTNEKDTEALWAKGGELNPNSEDSSMDITSPSIEELNIKEIEQELKTTKDVLSRIKEFLEKRKLIIQNTPSSWPTEGYIISKFGFPKDQYTSENGYHQGVGIAAFPGAEIKASAPGKVQSVYWDPSNGLSVLIEHRYGFYTVYSHCENVIVKEPEKLSNGKIRRQEVAKGEVIGYVGRTGKSGKYMCYYQVRIGTVYVDPIPYLNIITQ